jgi:peptidoglycan/xylan/chitin deacetylase (PgdA/CDA1 family)
MYKRIIILLVLILALAGCSSAAEITPSPIALPPSQTPMPTLTKTPRPTRTATPVPSPTEISTATVPPTPTWAVAGPGEVEAPILMYHRVDPEKPTTHFSYNVHPEEFAAQMQLLSDLGYHTITASQLVEAIRQGAQLPPRPIVITFDDGNITDYQYAFPIMQAHGFFGVSYVVANRLGADGFTGGSELEEMIAAGWEVGSHGYTHADLTVDHSKAYGEINGSRERIYDVIEINVDTFAYPFGAIDPYIGDRTRKWGYSAAMGLGKSYTHTTNSLYYLQRIEVFGDYDLETFQTLLPWTDPVE